MARNRTARVNCGCGHDFFIKVTEVTVLYCKDFEDWTYAFRCPECHNIETKRFPDHTLCQVMISAGAPVREWTMPDLSDRIDAPAITQDDVDDLVRAMNNHDRLAAYAI